MPATVTPVVSTTMELFYCWMDVDIISIRTAGQDLISGDGAKIFKNNIEKNATVGRQNNTI